MAKQISEALLAFREKNGIGDMFGAHRFTLDFPKDVALSRVCVWSAVNDYFAISSGLTAGQITTITDSAPMIGPDALKELRTLGDGVQNRNKCLGLMRDFIQERAEGWWTGISAAAQTWSLYSAAGADPKNLMRNSKFEKMDAIRLGVVAWHQLSGDISRESNWNPTALLSRIEGAVEAIAEKSNSDKMARWIAERCVAGGYDEVAAWNVVGDFIAANPREATVQAAKGRALGKYAFLGSRTPDDYKALVWDRSRPADMDLSEFMEALPGTSFPAIVAKHWGKSSPLDIQEDLLAASLEGYSEGMGKYSPIVTPDVTRTDVAKITGGTTLRFFEADSYADEEEAFGQPVYEPSRFAGYVKDTWMAKRIRQVVGGADLVDSSGYRAILNSVNERITALAGEVPRAEAERIALEEVSQSLTNSAATPDAAYGALATLEGVAEHITAAKGGRFVSLDRTAGEGGTELYNFYPDDKREEWASCVEFAHTATDLLGEDEPLRIELGEMDREMLLQSMPFAARFDKLTDDLSAKNKRSALLMLQEMAAGRAPDEVKLQSFVREVSEVYGESQASKHFIDLISKSAGVLQEAQAIDQGSDPDRERAQTEMFGAGLVGALANAAKKINAHNESIRGKK